LMSGRGNLVKQVGEFKKLAPTIKDELPEYFIGKADLEIDLNRLNEDSSANVDDEIINIGEKRTA